MLYTHDNHLISVTTVIKHINTIGRVKYTADSVVQVRTFINFLISEFGSSTRGERDTILNHSILTKLKRSAHLVVFKISIGRDLQNSMIRLQLLNIIVLTQLDWPPVTTNSTRLQSSTQLTCFSKYPNSQPIASGHDVIHTPISFPIWGLL